MNVSSPENKKWYVIYTRSRAEKKVKIDLEAKSIECFVPMQKKLRQWKDRKKWVETPLISGYCFVFINRKAYDTVLQTDNVVCYVTFEGKAAVIPEQQIDSLKTLLKQFDFDVNVSHENFEPGRIVEIISGPMAGIRGELIEQRSSKKFILRLEQINSVFSVEVSADIISYLPDKL